MYIYIYIIANNYMHNCIDMLLIKRLAARPAANLGLTWKAMAFTPCIRVRSCRTFWMKKTISATLGRLA